jgi:Tfp pilus assembly protein PilN
MIRINLLRTMGVAGVGTNIGTSASTGGEIISVDVRRQAAIKVVVILLFPLMLFLWETVRTNALKDKQTILQQQVSAVETEKASFGSTAPRVEKANMLKEKIQKEIKVIREIARNRLREVKALDQLQTIMSTDKSWMTGLKISGNKVTIDGYSLSEGDFVNLLQEFSRNGYFTETPRTSTNAETHPTLGQIQKFSIELGIGKAEEI